MWPTGPLMNVTQIGHSCCTPGPPSVADHGPTCHTTAQPQGGPLQLPQKGLVEGSSQGTPRFLWLIYRHRLFSRVLVKFHRQVDTIREEETLTEELLQSN